ncbi:folylpolyglutamate synthase, mitochondrial-like, partial [Osmerus mordax]|uniref:folylpolyglutamate synthase, mitochondrial-like n=1 Tax=Osmerus mordax TaxID=8014 RepID=UPI00351077E3
SPGVCAQEAVCVLNTLQTNASVLEQVRRENVPELQLQAMRGFLHRTGLTVEQLDELNMIHVTGTKGKGSTCAFTDKILSNYGFRTGFYSSPHLVQVRERIRINGQPISKDLFTKYFWEVYTQLDATKGCHGDRMPAYFRFLTLLAFHVFMQEKVDLALIEVGIGGAYDCTNIIRRPWVCGITSLGIDHTSILGDTLEEIAWQKAGIFKNPPCLIDESLVTSHSEQPNLHPQPGVPAFSVRQPSGPMQVLHNRASEIGCSLRVCPELDSYEAGVGPLRLGLAGHQQRCNASLALQLSRAWLHRYRQQDDTKAAPSVENTLASQAETFKPSPVMIKGLQDTEWPGRTQTVRHGPVTYYLDGAHTSGSMQACVQWFREETALEERGHRGPVIRVLLFNATGERDCAAMLKLLVPCQFDYVVFCPNITETTPEKSPDQQNFNVLLENILTRCLDNQRSWQSLSGPETQQGVALRIHEPPLVEKPRNHTLVFPCILSALQWISQGRDPLLPAPAERGGSPHPQTQAGVLAQTEPLREAAHISVLITGSLHLVGGALRHLDPSLAG